MPLTTHGPVSSLEMFPAIGVLERADCERLLKRNMVGRLAFALHDHVSIVPVHYVYDEGWIYGRTEPGGKLVPILRNRRVAFEVDEHEGMFSWRSVVAQGALYLINPERGEKDKEVYTNALHLLRRILPSTLGKGDPVPFRNQLFRIQVSEMSGRSASLGGKRIAPRADTMRDDTAQPGADELLRASVIVALSLAVPTSTPRVHIDAFDGVVVLSGLAETAAERSLIEREVLGVENVKAVVQQLETAFPAREQPEPADIARSALNALESLDERAHRNIKVVVENDWLRVEGTVDNDAQRDEVIRSLRAVKGTRGAIDRIQIHRGSE
ncbi:MAG TPA: pyridoxamine 5'-phosphate oxidase family protein [Gemmatimonadaceae bacterium]